MRKPIKTGWPAITAFTAFLTGIFCGWLLISCDSPRHFYEQWRIPLWAAVALVGLCVFAELMRLKCPYCRSRAVSLLSAEEVDRWIGQKVVSENTIGVGAFQAIGQPKFRGMTENIAVARRTIPITKRCILEKRRCQTCGRGFERRVIEEMR